MCKNLVVCTFSQHTKVPQQPIHAKVSLDVAMLRLTFARTAAVARAASHARTSAITPRVVLQQVRYESSKTPEERKKLLEVRDDLQRDWDAKVITYEELKPKTLQPSPVSLQVLSIVRSA